jgi:DNA-directed RNA polymerase subunit omega
MARVTTEDALVNVSNRFILVKAAVLRARQLQDGVDPLVECDNKALVTALRELAGGYIAVDGDVKALEAKSIRPELPR